MGGAAESETTAGPCAKAKLTPQNYILEGVPSLGGDLTHPSVATDVVDPSAVAGALCALRDAATNGEVFSALSTVAALTNGIMKNCEVVAAANGKELVRDILASSTDSNVHKCGIGVLLCLANIEGKMSCE